MQLVDRYLQAVKRYLPADQRDDILRELSANILAEMEDREAYLGRPLTEDEQSAILGRQGSPSAFAGRYRSAAGILAFGPVLIGPLLFPFYVRILALNLFITLVLGSALRTFIAGQVAFSTLLLPACIQFFVITAIFTAVERYGLLDRWNPRDLPALRDPLRIKRANTICEMLFTAAFVLCWLRIPGALHAVAFLFLGPVASYFTSPSSHPLIFAPDWQLFYLPVLVIVLLDLAQQGLNFAFPRWTRNRLIARVSLSFLGVLLAFFLFRTGNLLLLNPDVPTAANYATLAALINAAVHYSLLAGIAISLAQIAWQLRRIARLTPPYHRDLSSAASRP